MNKKEIELRFIEKDYEKGIFIVLKEDDDILFEEWWNVEGCSIFEHYSQQQKEEL